MTYHKMAISKKGLRKIRVSNREFYWKFSGKIFVIQRRLNREGVNYMVKFNREQKNVIIKIKSSDVSLWFQPLTENSNAKTNEYHLSAFGKSDKDYDNFKNNF